MTESSGTAVKAILFDAYGTLFDVHSAVAEAGQSLGDKGPAVSQLWRQKQLEYTWLRSLMGAHEEFWQLTQDALDYALEAHGVTDAGLREALLQRYWELSAYPEVAETLAALKAAGLVTGILTNGSPAMIAAAVSSAGLGALLDQTFSVESVGIYKPDARVYDLPCKALGLAPGQIAFVSSNGWDARGAAHFGYRVFWANRAGLPSERLPGPPEAVIKDLRPLPGLVAKLGAAA